MQSSLRYDDASAIGRGARVLKERFAKEQYVRVQLNGNKTEIGVVADINETEGTITVTTRHGYDVTVRPEAVHRAFLVVLDLNGVLGARNRIGFKSRPHVAEFVKFVFNHFAVAVWTSGLERTSVPIIDAVFDGYQDRLLFTLFRDACVARPTPENLHGTFKDLQRIFDSYPQSFHSVNTIIIDDSPDKCSHPDIALCPIPFKDTPDQAGETGLLKVVQVLKEVLDTDSIHPLIRAAEERLALLRSTSAPTASTTAPPPPTVVPITETAEQQAHTQEITLWRTRLCCENLQGRCRYGAECRFSHDADDGKRPCSRKDTCRCGHASRWVATETVETVDQRQRQRERERERERERARVASQREQFFLSKEELANVQVDGRSHTGIPRLDAQYEAAAHTPSASNAHQSSHLGVPAPRSSGRTPTNTFSTNPRASQQQPNSYAAKNVASQGYTSYAPVSSDYRGVTGPAPSSSTGGGGLDVSRLMSANSAQPRHNQSYRPQQSQAGQSSVAAPQPRSVRRDQDGGRGEIHLRGDARDGTALLKQLEKLTRQ